MLKTQESILINFTKDLEPAGVANQFDLIPLQPTIVPSASSPQPVQRSTLRFSNRNRCPSS